jgi:signal peptidase II
VSASPNRKYVVFAAFLGLSLALDQWTKNLARDLLRPRGSFNPKTIVEHYFDLRYSENPGVAFGMLQQLPGGRLVLTLLAVLAFVLVVAYLRKTEVGATRVHVALGLVGGGALGNVYDRVVYGKVTDFIVWHVKQHEWPAFNVADAALCVGVGLLMLDMFLTRPEKSSTPASSA